MLNGLAGLYGYFLCGAHAWMAEEGIAGWLIPSEFMDVNYGKQIKAYLLERVTLLRIHRFAPAEVQFNDALVSSAVVWFKNTAPLPDHAVEFSYGGTLNAPQVVGHMSRISLQETAKWTKFPISSASESTAVELAASDHLRLADLFTIKRGIATGANEFFILDPEQIERYKLPPSLFIPILPSPRYLPIDEIEADSQGNPSLERSLFLLSCQIPEPQVRDQYPALWNYLQSGVQKGISERYLCRHRTPWYSQEQRPAPPFLCTYMGRRDSKAGRPFRFIFNRSRATAPNVYLLLYPKPALQELFKAEPGLREQIWQALNQIPLQELVGEGRVYGGGLHKLEPRELEQATLDIRGILAPGVTQLIRTETPHNPRYRVVPDDQRGWGQSLMDL